MSIGNRKRRIEKAITRKDAGDLAEQFVCSQMFCPRCKRGKLKRLLPGSPCIDIICSFCGFVAQVKSHETQSWETETVWKLPGGSWQAQKERLEAGKWYPLFVVLIFKKKHYPTRPIKILYLPVEFQTPNIFQPRKKKARGSQKFDYVFDIRTQQFFFTVWEIMLVQDKGRIKLVEVTEGAFSQLPGRKRFPFRPR